MENESSEDVLPPIYCDPTDFGQNRLFLAWILEKSSSTMMGDTEFQLFSLPALLYELYQSAEMAGEEKGRRSLVPSLVVAETQLARPTFMYQTETCELHGEGQPGRYHCCQARVLGWSYILLSLVCPLLSLPLLEDSHRPHGYSDPQLARSSRGKSSLSQSDLPSSNPSSSAPSSTSSVFGGSEADSEAAGKQPRGSGLSQISGGSSSYKPGTYSRTGSLASQVWCLVLSGLVISLLLFQSNLFVYLAGKGRGVSHHGRVIPMSQLRRADQSSSLDITSEKSYLSTLN